MTGIRKTKAEKLELLKQQKIDLEKRLKAKSQKLDARIKIIEAKESTDARKNDTRNKILVGAMILDRIQNGKTKKDWLDMMMDEFLTRDSDRLFYGLEPKNLTTTDINNLDGQINDLLSNCENSQNPNESHVYN